MNFEKITRDKTANNTIKGFSVQHLLILLDFPQLPQDGLNWYVLCAYCMFDVMC